MYKLSTAAPQPVILLTSKSAIQLSGFTFFTYSDTHEELVKAC
jgi:hypothetical protein